METRHTNVRAVEELSRENLNTKNILTHIGNRHYFTVALFVIVISLLLFYRQRIQIDQSNVLNLSRQQAKHSCNICKKSLKNSQNLRKHMKTFHTQKSHECDVCGKKFGFEAALKQHRLKHENRKAFKCRICLKEYCTRSNLDQHILTHNPDRATYRCDEPECNKPFLAENTLRRHKQQMHVHKCEMCDMKLSTKRNLMNHMISVHEKDSGYNSEPTQTTPNLLEWL